MVAATADMAETRATRDCCHGIGGTLMSFRIGGHDLMI